MPGFFIVNKSTEFKIANYDNTRCCYNSMKYDNWDIQRNTLNKFIDDKIFLQDENYIIITEGVILNKKQLLEKYNCSNLFELIIVMQKNKTEFYKDFRGSFSGAIYDKNKHEWNVYTNHYGDNAIFYYNNNGISIIASDINYIINYLKNNHIKYTMDENALYYILTYAFMGDDSTIVSEIKRLAPGSVITLNYNGLCEIREYYRLSKNKYNLSNWSDEKIVNRLDELFRNAIKLEYDKDLEYGYEHLSDLSAGLDSRMNVWVAHEMEYHNMTNITYAQTGSADENIPKQIAKALNTKHIFYSLDNAECIMDIDGNVLMTGGAVAYYTITGGRIVLENLDKNKFGIEHTGQIGDVVIGTFLKSPSEYTKNVVGGMYSDVLSGKITDNPLDKYEDYEQYMMYVRGFRGALSSHFIRRNFVEVASPFLNIEFLEFCFSIPIEKRIGHKIYFKWVKTKYPQAAKFIWGDSMVNLFAPKWLSFLYKVIYKGPNKILRIFKKDNAKPTGMNPMNYWYLKNNNLKNYLDSYYKDNISNPKISQSLKEDMQHLYNSDSVLSKGQVLTVLSIIKQYFS
ncbi:MAG: hypothetical protein RSF13_00025 [Clostridiales bacterium]